MGPPPEYRTWERLGELMPDPERPMLSESGLSICRQQGSVTTEQLKRDLSFLAVGIPSNSFIFNEKFEMASGVTLSGLSLPLLKKLIVPLLECGDNHQQLELFVDDDSDAGLLCIPHLGICQLVQSLRWLTPPLHAVSKLCKQANVSVNLLEQLCHQACVLPPGRSACVLYSLLRSVAAAYFRILGNWLFEGVVESDAAREFFVQLQPGVLQLQTRQFWTQGFVLLESRVPSFLHGLEEPLMQCGKAVCLLKLCNPKDPLVFELREERPELDCCLQPSELSDLQNEWEAYSARARHLCGPVVNAASQLERSKEQQQAFLDMVLQAQQERLRQIREDQKIEREAKRQAHLKLQADLRQQMGEARARKEELQRQEQKEEEERRIILMAQQAEDDRRELSAASEKRLQKAERRIQILKNELGQDAADENSNPISEPADANANLSDTVRNVPTSLALNTTDQLENMKNDNENKTLYKVASSEAARNKARVLGQEMNLITHYNETSQTDGAQIQPNNTASQEAARNKARVMHQEWSIFPTKPMDNNQESLDNKQVKSPSTESLVSPVSSTSSEERTNNNQGPTMTVSVESARSQKTELETPTGTCPMSISMETSSIGNLPSPSSAMTDSKVTFADTPTDVPTKILPTSVSSSSFLSALSVLSEPFKWHSSTKKDSIKLNTALKKLDISSSNLSHLLHQTVSVVLSTQLKLVNQSILKLFIQDEQLLSHFHSLRQYFLLVDGEFARNITEGLCQGMSEHAKDPSSLLSFVSLDTILRRSLSNSVHGIKDINTDRLSMAKGIVPTEFKLGDSVALNCVQLQYQVAWPLCLIITPDALFQYDRIFSFLIGLRRGMWAVDECFQWLQQPPSNINPRELAKSFQYHQLRLFRHEMGNFVQAFHYYIMNVAVLRCWTRFKTNLKRASTLDELYKSHTSFIKRVIFFCLLRQEASEVQKLLQAVLRSFLKFHIQLTSHQWLLRGDQYEHPAMKNLTIIFAQFKERTRILLRHMTKIADRGYQQELYELLHALNMNEYYSLNL
ncbi:hypothetical protein B566_EDAN014997 [Ephemera danica]|nr:hypothetical protein B566_EDAN014997 [Ephemera danica]